MNSLNEKLIEFLDDTYKIGLGQMFTAAQLYQKYLQSVGISDRYDHRRFFHALDQCIIKNNLPFGDLPTNATKLYIPTPPIIGIYQANLTPYSPQELAIAFHLGLEDITKVRYNDQSAGILRRSAQCGVHGIDLAHELRMHAVRGFLASSLNNQSQWAKEDANIMENLWRIIYQINILSQPLEGENCITPWDLIYAIPNHKVVNGDVILTDNYSNQTRAVG